MGTNKRPALSAKFQFEDHIRCVAARQCLQRNKENLRLAKMTRIAKLLHLPLPEGNAENQQEFAALQSPSQQEASFVPVVSFPPITSGDLTQSAVHHTLQAPLMPIVSSEDIEMIQFQPASCPMQTLPSNEKSAPLKSHLESQNEPFDGLPKSLNSEISNNSPAMRQKDCFQQESLSSNTS